MGIGSAGVRMMAISTDLYCVLKHWYDDANSDDPSLMVTGYGLCAYVDANTTLVSTAYELSTLLRNEFDDTTYPFDNHDSATYSRASNARQQHMNPHRRAWVAGKLYQYEKDNLL